MKNTIWFVDLDDTTFWCNVNCRVTDKRTGETFRTQDFSKYYMDKENYEMSFIEYRLADVFETAEPIENVHNYLKVFQNEPSNRFIYLTARGTMDNVEKVKERIRSFGLKVDDIMFSGDLMDKYPDISMGQAKASVIHHVMELMYNIDNSIKFSMIDDNKNNLRAVIEYFGTNKTWKKRFDDICSQLVWHNPNNGLLSPFYG